MQIQSETYDSGTLIEVFEHIPPDEAPSFVSGIANSLKRDAMLFVTVPSTEVPVSDKHYRHFDFGSIQHCFSGQFHVVSCFGFEKSSVLSRILKRLMIQRRIYIETSVTSNYFVKEYARTFPEVRGCGRIGLFLSKK